jgi:hypothetical protein
MFNSFKPLLVVALLGLTVSAAQAAAMNLAKFTPQESLLGDAASLTASPVSQSVGLETYQNSHRVTRVEWWGVLVPSNAPRLFDVWFNDTQIAAQAGVDAVLDDGDLTDGIDLWRFTIDIASGGLGIGATNSLKIQYGAGGGSSGSEAYWAYSSLTPDILSYSIDGEEITAVPEPSSAWLVALAGLGLVASRRRQA